MCVCAFIQLMGECACANKPNNNHLIQSHFCYELSTYLCTWQGCSSFILCSLILLSFVFEMMTIVECLFLNFIFNGNLNAARCCAVWACFVTKRKICITLRVSHSLFVNIFLYFATIPCLLYHSVLFHKTPFHFYQYTEILFEIIFNTIDWLRFNNSRISGQ